MGKQVVIVGGGVAGMQAALSLKARGAEPVIVERGDRLGGKVAGWHKLFPTFTPVEDVLGPMLQRVQETGIEVHTGAEVEALVDGGVVVKGGGRFSGDATVICSGFDVFDARRKEEYGYGIYDNVITTVDLERMFNEGHVATVQGAAPHRVAFLHCCITAVKQAIEMKKLFPAAEIYNFYMDIRMFGPGYEELYRRAQLEYNINFVRGRISEASQAMGGKVQIKAEDTLIGRPLKMTVDMLVLIVGMKGGASNASYAAGGLVVADNGFMQPLDSFCGNVLSGKEGIFYAGAVTAPKNIGDSLNEGSAVADRVAEYLKL